MDPEDDKRAAREEHRYAVADLQDAVDQTAKPGNKRQQRQRLRRAQQRERDARDALDRE